LSFEFFLYDYRNLILFYSAREEIAHHRFQERWVNLTWKLLDIWQISPRLLSLDNIHTLFLGIEPMNHRLDHWTGEPTPLSFLASLRLNNMIITTYWPNNNPMFFIRYSFIRENYLFGKNNTRLLYQPFCIISWLSLRLIKRSLPTLLHYFMAITSINQTLRVTRVLKYRPLLSMFQIHKLNHLGNGLVVRIWN
jgi:hypothetical protein